MCSLRGTLRRTSLNTACRTSSRPEISVMERWVWHGWEVSLRVGLCSEVLADVNESKILDNRGGICEKPAKDIFEGQRIIKTLNTGVITIINHHFRTSALMTELTFAHEVGHSLGAEVSRSDGSRGLNPLHLFSTTMKHASVVASTGTTSCIDAPPLAWKITITSFRTAVWRRWDRW